VGLVVVVAALSATFLANVVNNLPATLLLLPLLAPVGVGAILAALVGVNVGSGLTWTGALANLLWQRTLTRGGAPPTSREFHAVSLVLTPPAVVLAVLTLWAWLHVF
jgi:arsenical pump membrane protein